MKHIKFIRAPIAIMSRLIAFALVFKSIAGAESPSNFDTTQGKRAKDQYNDYREEQEQRARALRDGISPTSVNNHPYHDGTGSVTEVIENIAHDIMVTLNPETYDDCLQYEEIGACLSVLPEGLVSLTPYVRYWGPWQKSEHVPEMFRTGYLPKSVVQPIKQSMIAGTFGNEKYYEDFIPNVAQKQIDYGLGVTAKYLNEQLGHTINLAAIPTINPTVIAKTREIIESRGQNMGEAAPYQDGYLFNEYHLMPNLPSIYPLMKPPDEDPFYGWCHNQKFPLLWYSEGPGANIYSRYSAQSQLYFPNEMALMQSSPFNCLGFNVQNGYTPQSLAGLALTSIGLPCQGYNQGPWVPVTNKVNTMYQTTAAAIGSTRAKIAYKRMPFFFYNISPEVDKVQWIRNSRMDGSDNPEEDAPADPKVKKCSKPGGIKKFVLDYKKGNLKIAEGADKDHWNVVSHWRKVRCCPMGGVPIFVGVPDETLLPIPEGEIDY